MTKFAKIIMVLVAISAATLFALNMLGKNVTTDFEIDPEKKASIEGEQIIEEVPLFNTGKPAITENLLNLYDAERSSDVPREISFVNCLDGFAVKFDDDLFVSNEFEDMFRKGKSYEEGDEKHESLDKVYSNIDDVKSYFIGNKLKANRYNKLVFQVAEIDNSNDLDLVEIFYGKYCSPQRVQRDKDDEEGCVIPQNSVSVLDVYYKTYYSIATHCLEASMSE